MNLLLGAAPVREVAAYAQNTDTFCSFAALVRVARAGGNLPQLPKSERHLDARLASLAARGLVRPSAFHPGGWEMTAAGWLFLKLRQDAWEADQAA